MMQELRDFAMDCSLFICFVFGVFGIAQVVYESAYWILQHVRIV